jgi:hypothetical protein
LVGRTNKGRKEKEENQKKWMNDSLQKVQLNMAYHPSHGDDTIVKTTISKPLHKDDQLDHFISQNDCRVVEPTGCSGSSELRKDSSQVTEEKEPAEGYQFPGMMPSDVSVEEEEEDIMNSDLGLVEYWKTWNQRRRKKCKETGKCTCFEGVGSVF